jgi:hypothetical protein
MSGVKFNCGDLVVCSRGYNNGISIYWWCNLLDIVVDQESHNSYVIVTGHGDKNTNALLKLKPVGVSKGDIWGFDSKIKPIDEEIFYTEKTHDIHLVETDYMKRIYDSLIKTANSRMDFIMKHRSRSEKLDEILD